MKITYDIPPIDNSREARANDRAGTPVGLIELAGREGMLCLIQGVLPERLERMILVEYPFGQIWRNQTGCRRFVEFRDIPPEGATRYALITEPAATKPIRREASVCLRCERRSATEHGRCGICGELKDGNEVRDGNEAERADATVH